MSGWPDTLNIFKKFPILNGDETPVLDFTVLALSIVKNVGVCLSTSKPLTYALPADTTETNLLESPAGLSVDVNTPLLDKLLKCSLNPKVKGCNV